MTHRLDMAIADVHVPGGIGVMRKKRRAKKPKPKPNAKATRSKRMRGKLQMALTHPDGTRIEVRHMSDAPDGVLVLPPVPLETDT